MESPTDPTVEESADQPGPLPTQSTNWGEYVWRHARRVVVFVVGSTIVLIGIVMLVMPGPGTLVIPLGLAVLATEFAWAAWLLKMAKRRLKQLVSTKTSPERSTTGDEVNQKQEGQQN